MKLKFGTKEITEDSPTFIVAELSANHGHKYDIAARTIEAMKKSGADAVKLQTYTPDTITLNSVNDCFKIKQGTIWDGANLYDLYKDAFMPWEWQPKLKKVAENLGIECFSSPFDNSAIDFLEEMNVPAYKIASFEITDIPLIEYAASKGKPMIISTGIAELSDIVEAIAACKRVGNDQVIILKCTSSYPAPYEEINLATIPDMEKKLKVLVGLSDHTMGFEVAIAGCALGARMIEKHFILDRSQGGPDATFSMEPVEFKAMVDAIRNAEKSVGHINYNLTKKAKDSREFCRSLFITEDMAKGEVFSTNNIRSIRPGFGLPPKYLKEILGKKASADLKKGTPLSWDHIKN